MKGVLSGKHYNRSVSCHKVMHEALQRLRLEAFLDTLDDDVVDSIYSFTESMRDSIFDEDVQGYVESQQFDDLVHQYENFIVETSAKSKTFSYWSIYLKMTGKALFSIHKNFTGC